MSKVKYSVPMLDKDFYTEETEHRLIGWCESCGMEVFTGDEALIVIANGDVIHSACWDYYAIEHAELFTKSADTREGC